MLPFLPGRAAKTKHTKTNPDIVPYSHDPPGHTCGLPCCSEDLQIQLRIRKPPRSCIGIQEFDVIQQNFTFRGRLNPRNRPTLESGFYSIQAPKDIKRGTIPKFGSVSVGGLKRISDDQRQLNFLKGREITLPESKDPNAVEKLYLDNFDVGESDDVLFVSDDEIEYYLTIRSPGETNKGVPYTSDPNRPSLYPWDMLKEAKYSHGNEILSGDRAEDSSSCNYYEVLRYPGEMNQSLQTTKPVKQFNITVPLPPKLPAQTIFNHPPLSKVSSPVLCENYLKQIAKGTNPPQKFNTYSSVYSLYNPANLVKDPYGRHLSLDRGLYGHRPHRQDVRDINFLNETRQGFDIHDKQSDILHKVNNFAQEVKKSSKNYLPLNRNNVNDFKEELNSKLKFKDEISKQDNLREIFVSDRNYDDEKEEDDDLGLDNPAFKHVNIDGKVHSTKTLNIDGKLSGTRSLDYRKQIQGLSEWEKEENINKTKSLDYRHKTASSRVMDMEGNALETKNLELLDKFCSEKLISLMEDESGTDNQQDDDNPITLIL